MRKLRAGIPQAERARLADRIAERVLELPEVRSARTVLAYASFGTEVPTEGLLRRLHERGARVLLPYLEGDAIRAAEIAPGEELAPSAYGPPEPSWRIPVDPAEIDLVLSPGLAFDRRGHRLGYGAGAYDRFLARLAPTAAVVGLAFVRQIVEEVPIGPEDARVHVVVTEDGVLDAR